MEFKAGDMIRVVRKNKDNYHYALYAGQEEVIYYSETPGEEAEVVKTTLDNFKKRGGFAEVVDFPLAKNGRSTLVGIGEFKKIKDLISEGTWAEWFANQVDECVLCTIWETIAKAKDMIDKTDELKFNNGEHFVWWCKVELKRADKKAKILDDLLNPAIVLPRFKLSKKS